MEQSNSVSKGKKLIVLGFVAIALLFIIYARYQDSELLTPSAIEAIQRIAYIFYIALIASFGAIALGMYRYHKGKIERNEKDLSTIIALATWNKNQEKFLLQHLWDMGYFLR